MPTMFAITIYLTAMTLFLGVSILIVRRVSFYRSLVRTSTGGRYEALDGLRGFLATSVFVHHALIYRDYFLTGQWHEPANTFAANLGNRAVVVFFLITGFLFWSKAIAGGGRVAFGRLFRSRFRRLIPMYLASVFMILAVLIIQTGGTLTGTPTQLAAQIARLCSVGVVKFDPINGINPSTVNAGVHWTLRYEIIFYALLPLLAVVATRTWAVVLLLGVLTVTHLVLSKLGALPLLLAGPWWAVFACGMLSAHLVRIEAVRTAFQGRLLGAISVACVAAVMGFDIPVLLAAGLSLIPFLAALSGQSFGGLLTCMPAKCLGVISYSIYLIHGIVLYTVLSLLVTGAPGLLTNDTQYVVAVLASGIVLLAVASLTYRFVEHPFIATVGPPPASAQGCGRLADQAAAIPAGEPDLPSKPQSIQWEFEPVLSATSSRSRGEVQQAFLGGPDFRLGQPGT